VISLGGLQGASSSAAKRPGWGPQADLRTQVTVGRVPEDRLELSQQAKALARKEAKAPKPLPAFGRFEAGGPEPLPFGPDLKANILSRIPGDGIETPPEGVQLGHQPARGLNILA